MAMHVVGSTGTRDLGPIVQVFRPSAASTTAKAVSLLLASLALVAWAVFTKRYTGKGLPLGFLGIVGSIVMFIIGAYRCGKVVYVCENGIRFASTEIAWDEIDAVTIHRSREAWDVRILGRDGAQIRLTETFLDHVPNKAQLLAALAPYVRC